MSGSGDAPVTSAPVIAGAALAKRVAAIAAPLRAALQGTDDNQGTIDAGDIAMAVRRLDALREDLDQGLIL